MGSTKQLPEIEMQTMINEVRYTIGLNMKCVKVVTKVTLVHVKELDANGYDCVIEERGSRSFANTNELYMTKAEAKAAM
jgi:hypothetical protein